MNLQVIKRNKRVEKWNEDKFNKQLEFTFLDVDFLIPTFKMEVMKQLNIKENITSNELLQLYINTAKNLISELYPEFDLIAGRFLMQKYQKQYFGIKHSTQYPKFSDFVLLGATLGVFTNKVLKLSKKVLNILDEVITPETDYNIKYVGVVNLFEKYLLTVGDKKELPQLGYMRLALAPYLDELLEPKFYKNVSQSVVIQKVIKRYIDLKNGYYTEATPKWLSSLTNKMQSASCVVLNPGDDTDSINKSIFDTGKYSKYGGGIGWYLGNLRSNGSKVGVDGKSNGVVPFAKMLEATVNAYNQQGKRKGSAIVWIDWFHQDILNVVMLNDKGGADEHRARDLKIGIVINKLLLKKAINNEDVALFDPKEVDLNKYKSEEDFNEAYEKYSKDSKLNIKFVNARELVTKIIRQRKRTGDIYIMFKEVVNGLTSPFNKTIYQSNLCSEIFLPTQPTGLITHKAITTDFNKTTEILEFGISETWLCNLASVNIDKFMELNDTERFELMYNILEAQDNIIEYSFYPNKSGEYTNKMYRPIGIGINNLAYYFAKKGVAFNSIEALIEMNDIMEKLQTFTLLASTKLAKERGAFPKIKETKWSDEDWVFDFVDNILTAEKVIQYGVRFSTHFAIAPTSTSSLIIGATEGIEPITDYFYNKVTDRGTIPQVVPGLRKYRENYVLAKDVEPEQLVKLAGIRQKYMEQGQSVNIYETDDKDKSYSVAEELKLWLQCYKEGVKSLYYFKGRKGSDKEECLSCSS